MRKFKIAKKNTKNTNKPKSKTIGYLKKTPLSVTLYVGGLRYDKSEQALLKIFNKFGYVNFVRVTRDKRTQRSNGTAFIQMENSESAEKAIAGLDGTQFEGRTLNVRVALEGKKNTKKKVFRKRK